MTGRLLTTKSSDQWWFADKERCPNMSFECYFRKLSPCTDDDLLEGGDQPFHPPLGVDPREWEGEGGVGGARVVFLSWEAQQMVLLRPLVRMFFPRKYQRYGGLAWFRSQIMSRIFRLKSDVLEAVWARMPPVIGEAGGRVIGVHVRRGDKYTVRRRI